LAAQGSIVRFLLPSFGQKVVWPIRYLSFEFSQFMIFIIYSLYFSDIKLMGSFDMFFITVFSKYYGYRQPSIFCHARLKFILVRNDPFEIDLTGTKWKSVDCIWNRQRRWENCASSCRRKIWNEIWKLRCRTKCHARFFDLLGAQLSYTTADCNETLVILSTHCGQLLVKISVRRLVYREKEEKYRQYVTRDFVLGYCHARLLCT